MLRIKELKGKKMFSFDAETNGLWGDPFSIAAIVYDPDGKEIDRLLVRCPIDGEIDPFVKTNVLPVMEDIKITHSSLREMIEAFIQFYHAHRDAMALVHMGHVVEARIFRLAHEMGLIEWDGAPYEWLDSCLLLGDSVDSYNKENSILVKGSSHNPLYDVEANYRAFRHALVSLETNEEDFEKRKKVVEAIKKMIVRASKIKLDALWNPHWMKHPGPIPKPRILFRGKGATVISGSVLGSCPESRSMKVQWDDLHLVPVVYEVLEQKLIICVGETMYEEEAILRGDGEAHYLKDHEEIVSLILESIEKGPVLE